MAPGSVPRLPSGLAARLGRLQALFVRAFGPNGDLKVLSVLLAAILFFAIRPFAVGNTKTWDLPVRVASTNPYVTVVDFAPKTTSVTLRGPRNKIDSFDPTQLAMEIEEPFPDTEGRVFRPLGARTLHGAGALKFLSCQADKVRVELDYTGTWETTNLVAVPALSGRPVEGGTATVRLADGAVVVVKGSIRKLNAFRDTGLLLPTEPVDVEGKTASFDVPVAIKIPADSGITSVEPQAVLAHVDISIAVTNRTETAAPGLLKDVEPPPAAAPAAEEAEAVPDAAGE
ncbi:MAG: hypothetical protein IJV65_01505 [Kiritimatiellae bacterium]|nr:hypothetical protein [Kiritimatiellia bacterium]